MELGGDSCSVNKVTPMSLCKVVSPIDIQCVLVHKDTVSQRQVRWSLLEVDCILLYASSNNNEEEASKLLQTYTNAISIAFFGSAPFHSHG